VSPPSAAAATRTGVAGLLVVLFAVAFGTNVPSPILLRYRADLGLSGTEVTAIFAIYAAGLLPALFLAGPASDRFGRRPVVAPFVVLSGLASLVFLPAVDDVGLLYLARFLQGAVSGAVFSVGSAWVADLARADVAARHATIALSLGFGLGPLAGGLMGQWAPAPTTSPYLVHVALVVVALALLWRIPDVSPRQAGGPVLNLGVPAGAGRAFAWFAVPAAACVFAFPSLSITVLPLELQDTMQGFDIAIAGVVAALTMTVGVLVQPVAQRAGAVRIAWWAPTLGAIGLLLAVVADVLDLWPALLPAAILLGAAYGLSLIAGLTATERLAAPTARGALTASFYAVAYVGFGTPVVVQATARGGNSRLSLLVVAVVAGVLAYLLAGPGRRALADAPAAVHPHVQPTEAAP
jgi:MFS family permease